MTHLTFNSITGPHDISRQSALCSETNFPELGYARKLLVMWGNLVEFGRIDLAAGRLNRGVLNEKRTSVEVRLYEFGAGLGTKNASIMLILVYFVWFGEICPSFVPAVPFDIERESNSGSGESTEGKCLAIISLILSISSTF